MATKEQYDLARWAMKTAIEKGAQEVSVNVFNSVSSSVEVRDMKIDKLEQANQAGMSISIMVDKKYSANSTNRLNDKGELIRFIEDAIEGTRFLSEDKFRALPDAELYYKGGGADLKVYDSEYEHIDPQVKIDLAFAVEKEVLGSDEKIISMTASYSDSTSRGVMVTSNGFEGDGEKSSFSVYASVSVDGEDARPQSGWGESSIYFNKLDTQGIAKTALNRAKRKIGQKKIASGKMTMIVENRFAPQLLGPLLAALNGSSIQQRNSFLIDSMHKQVASEKLTVIDDPTIISGRGSKHFDTEGLAVSKRTIFDKGILKSFYIDTYYGRKLGMNPTSGGITNLVIKTGIKTPGEILASIDRGILVTGFNGGNANGSTGDFSYGIEGFLIENGKETLPVSEMNITGNMKKLWMNLTETGNDPYKNSSWMTPTLVFEDVEFSGL